MNNKKIKYIEILLKKREADLLGGAYNLLIHSVINTFEIEKLIEYYLQLPDSELKKSIESNIYKRVQLTDNTEKLYDKLYGLLKDTDYYKRQRIRKILMLLLPFLDNIYRKDFFNYFYNSKYVYDISAALSICGEIWDNDLNSQILSDYLNKKNEIYLKTFLEYGNTDGLLPYLEKIWQNEPSNYLKLDIIRKLSKKHIDKFEFIRDAEPEKYLLAVSFSEKEFDNEFLVDCLNDITEDLKPYGILSLSHLNKWELIENEIKKYANKY